MLLDNPFAPIDGRVYKEAKTLIKHGHSVTLVCKRNDDLSLPPAEEIDGISVRRLFKYHLGTSVKVDYCLAAHHELISALTDPFDVYHCHDAETWPVGYMLSSACGGRFVCDAHEYFPDFIYPENYTDEFKYRASKMLWLIRGAYITHADAVITVGEKIAELLRGDYSLAETPTVIYNSRSLSERVTVAGDVLRKRHKIERDKRILLFHGNIEPSRGIENLIDAVSLVEEDAVLLLAGNCAPQYASQLLDRSEKLKMADRVRVIGFLHPGELLQSVAGADLNLYYPVADTKNVLCSIPNKFFDYVFAGVPFIVSDLAELGALCRKYQIGYVCGSVMEMAGLIDRLLSDESEYARTLPNFRRAQEELCWERQEARLGELYQRLCAV
jgi:glycosyltransferase involved in cell wall biosynthesis